MDLHTALNYCSIYSTHAICAIGAVHLLFFFGLWLAFRGRLRRLAAMLEDFTRGLRQRSVLDRSAHLTDQIEAFLADVNEVLQHPERTEERRSCWSGCGSWTKSGGTCSRCRSTCGTTSRGR